VVLFRRKPRGVELTDAGRAFLDNARATLSQFDYTFETTRRAARGEQGRICVGYTIQTAVHPQFLRVIREFREAFPLVSVSRLAFVAVGLGVALVLASMQRLNIEGVVFRHLKGSPQPRVPFNLATRRGDASVVVRNFPKLARKTAMSY
jgi:DNA-binding transcriptional LysR family regulator